MGEQNGVNSGAMKGVHGVDLFDLSGWCSRKTDVITLLEESIGRGEEHGRFRVIVEHVDPWSKIEGAVDDRILVSGGDLLTHGLHLDVAT